MATDWTALRDRHIERWTVWVRAYLAAKAALKVTAIFLLISIILGGASNALGFFEIKEKVNEIIYLIAEHFPLYRGFLSDNFNSVATTLFFSMIFTVEWFRCLDEARKKADEWFPCYNPLGFEPVRYPVNETGATRRLPWSEDSSMADILVRWRRRLRDPAQTGDDRHPFFRRSRGAVVPVRFDYYLVLGRPGAGKSRLAEELTRDLSRRDLLGDGARKISAQEFAGRELARGDARRTNGWWRKRRPDDPWDSGKIEGAGPIKGVAPSDFETWRPARPTILWMDDPDASTARDWLQRLNDYSKCYRFPVRLIIVNQSTPEGIEHPANSDNVTILRGETYFTVEQILALAKKASLNPFNPQLAERVHDLTDGNPLLVELAFDFLWSGKSIMEIGPDDLIAERVRRVQAAPVVADPIFKQPPALIAIALGTLLGPDLPHAALRNRLPSDFSVHGLSAPMLERAFPAEKARGANLAAVFPMIKPEVIGNAWVKSLAKIEAQIPMILNDAVFAIAPERWARLVGQLGRGNDPTADAFCTPPADLVMAGLAHQELALKAWMTLAHYGWRDAVSILA